MSATPCQRDCDTHSSLGHSKLQRLYQDWVCVPCVKSYFLSSISIPYLYFICYT